MLYREPGPATGDTWEGRREEGSEDGWQEVALLLLLPEQLPSLPISSVAGPFLDHSGNIYFSDMLSFHSQRNVSWDHNALAALLITVVSSNLT